MRFEDRCFTKKKLRAKCYTRIYFFIHFHKYRTILFVKIIVEIDSGTEGKWELTANMHESAYESGGRKLGVLES